jgi:hypothetical protein
MPRIYGVTDSPHGSGPLRPPASAGAVAGHYVGLIEFVGGAYDGCHHDRVASMPGDGNGPVRPRIVSIPLAGRTEGDSRSKRGSLLPQPRSILDSGAHLTIRASDYPTATGYLVV